MFTFIKKYIILYSGQVKGPTTNERNLKMRFITNTPKVKLDFIKNFDCETVDVIPNGAKWVGYTPKQGGYPMAILAKVNGKFVKAIELDNSKYHGSIW